MKLRWVKLSERAVSNGVMYSSPRKCISKTHGYDSTLKGVDESLARFGFGKRANVRSRLRQLTLHYRLSKDYIDLFLIHDPFSGTERRLETYRALLDAQKAGKIRTVGVSN
ncbi:hypothetical protein J3R83DRAFT_3950 [Lanmaoa asiatica]|nr:hypothetical protein J3R83DRAFT_3950 [Lanmaoa asiatica]